MLLDGGYLNNLPGDVIRQMGADMVIAIDVGSEEDKSQVSYGDSLSGWYALLSRWNPFSKGQYIPSLADIQSRLAYVSCVKQLEEVKNMDRCMYLRPPVSHYGTLEFGKFEEIFETGNDFQTSSRQLNDLRLSLWSRGGERMGEEGHVDAVARSYKETESARPS
jgi:lysophospholipid hydrolase